MNADTREWLTLPVLVLIGGLLLTGVYLGTAARIDSNRQHAADTILLDALSLPTTNTELRAAGSTADTELLMLREPRRIYLATQHGKIVALVLPLSARGYGGPIDLIAGIASDGKIIAVRATSHRETAGLGDRIDSDKSAWIKQFIGKSLRTTQPEQWAVKNSGGDFDQITGATITSRAVIDAVYRALQYFDLHREQLLPATASPATEAAAATLETDTREIDHE